MLQKMRVLLLVCLVAVLAACGGGGSASNDEADKYVGSWKGCIPSGQADAPYYVWIINLAKTSPKSLNGNIHIQNAYSNANCTSLVQGVDYTNPYSVTLIDQKTVQGNTVDRVDVIESGNAYKDIFFVSGNTFYFGSNSGQDAQGYPTAFTTPLTKQ